MNIDRFDSLRYRPIEDFETVRRLREEVIEWRSEHEVKFSEIPPKAEMRYALSIQEYWWEEAFLFSDGERLVFYHDLPIEADGQAYLQQVCAHYGFLGGLKWENQTTDEEYRRKTIQALLADEQFSYQNAKVIFEDGAQLIPIAIHLLADGNVLIEAQSTLDDFQLVQLKTKLMFLLPGM